MLPPSPPPWVPSWLMKPHLHVLLCTHDMCNYVNSAMTPHLGCFLVYICILSCTCCFFEFCCINDLVILYVFLYIYYFLSQQWFRDLLDSTTVVSIFCYFELLVKPYLVLLNILHNIVSCGFSFTYCPNLFSFDRPLFFELLRCHLSFE